MSAAEKDLFIVSQLTEKMLAEAQSEPLQQTGKSIAHAVKAQGDITNIGIVSSPAPQAIATANLLREELAEAAPDLFVVSNGETDLLGDKSPLRFDPEHRQHISGIKLHEDTVKSETELMKRVGDLETLIVENQMSKIELLGFQALAFVVVTNQFVVNGLTHRRNIIPPEPGGLAVIKFRPLSQLGIVLPPEPVTPMVG